MMNEVQAETVLKSILLAAEPQLFVADVEVSCEFYTKKLGFTVAFTFGEPTSYGQFFRDGARLNFRQLDEPAICPELQARDHLLSASITSIRQSRSSSNFKLRASYFIRPSRLKRGAPAHSSSVILIAIFFFLQEENNIATTA